MTDRAYQAVPPGETIKELMGDRKVCVRALASHLRLSEWDVLCLLDGDYIINQALAKNLEKVFNVPAAFWLNLQAQYDKTKKRKEKK